MPLRRTFARLFLISSLAAAGLVASSAPALADFHLMKVREVSAGTTTQPNADFVELQMVFPFQTNVSGHVLHLYNAAGARMDCTLPTDVTNGSDNARILFATTEFQALAAPDPDFSIPPLLTGAGGGVCFETVDCVSWGSFGGTTTVAAGNPFPGGIPADQSIDRKATADDPQDTNDSAADFEAKPQDPQSNVPAPTPQATTCAGGPGSTAAATVQDLKARVRGGKAIIRGQVTPQYPGDTVSLTFFANGSPLRKVAKKNATLDADSRFKKGFRVPAESTRCKVKVRFRGAALGQKRFQC
jgi:hypothetical protein